MSENISKIISHHTEQDMHPVVLRIFFRKIPARLAVLFHMDNDEDELKVIRAATI
jgi:hypothetical protein